MTDVAARTALHVGSYPLWSSCFQGSMRVVVRRAAFTLAVVTALVSLRLCCLSGAQTTESLPGRNADSAALRELEKELADLRADVDQLLLAHRQNEKATQVLAAEVDSYEAMYRKVRALFDAQARGGEPQKEASVAYQLHRARSRLAWAQGSMEDCLRESRTYRGTLVPQ